MFRRILRLGMVLTASSAAQVGADRPHWGVQGDGGYATVPQSIVGRFTESLPERPDISGTTFSVGLVRFHATGSPSYSFQYSQLEADLSGSITVGSRTSFVAGSGAIRGGLVTKYLNIITRRSVSAGFALGAGAGQGELNYTRSVLATTLSQHKQYAQVLPMFEALAQVDIRPVRYLSVAPYFGMRTGVMVVGAAVRVHVVRK